MTERLVVRSREPDVALHAQCATKVGDKPATKLCISSRLGANADLSLMLPNSRRCTQSSRPLDRAFLGTRKKSRTRDLASGAWPCFPHSVARSNCGSSRMPQAMITCDTHTSAHFHASLFSRSASTNYDQLQHAHPWGSAQASQFSAVCMGSPSVCVPADGARTTEAMHLGFVATIIAIQAQRGRNMGTHAMAILSSRACL